MAVTLYRLEGCPFCEFVVDALEAHGVAYDSVYVAAHHSLRNEVRARSGQRQVPLLVDDERGVTMAEAARIIEYVETSYG